MWIWLILKNISLLDRIWSSWLVRFAHSPPTSYSGSAGWYFRNQSIHIQITYTYHIFCCNMFVFACPIIAKSQYGAIFPHFPSNIRIFPHISVFSLIYPYFPPNSTSGISAVVSKYKERWCIKICIKSYFNQINSLYWNKV
jgi:hypothetical protein